MMAHVTIYQYRAFLSIKSIDGARRRTSDDSPINFSKRLINFGQAGQNVRFVFYVKSKNICLVKLGKEQVCSPELGRTSVCTQSEPFTSHLLSLFLIAVMLHGTAVGGSIQISQRSYKGTQHASLCGWTAVMKRQSIQATEHQNIGARGMC